MTISIVIPAYEAGGRGVEFLSNNIDHILLQSFSDYEIIISDHSIDGKISKYLSYVDDDRIRYYMNSNGRGSSSVNLNNAIRYATGNIIKPMFQDDYLFHPKALEIIVKRFDEGAKWLVCGNNSTYDRKNYFNEMIPYWNDDIIYGLNTLSSPSCIAYLNNGMVWDERLIWLVDCKFYRELYDRYGGPTIEDAILVTNYGHEGQLTNTMGQARKDWELNLIKKEYGNRT